MVYISLDFSFFPLNFPPFLGIDHLENVSIRYRYPKVLGYRVLGIDIDPALASAIVREVRIARPSEVLTHTTNIETTFRSPDVFSPHFS